MKTVPIAKALVLDSDSNMLMLRRSKTHPTLASRRDLPGGLVEENEEPGEALRREILEETGLEVRPEQTELIFTGTEAYEDESRLRMLYLVRLSGAKPEVKISWEHQAFEWLPLSELESIEDDFHSFYHDALKYIRIHNLLKT